MKPFKEYLQESSLSRIWKHSQAHDYGTITAFRSARDCGKGKPYTKKENLQRNTSLLAKLRAKGYGVTAIKGSYIENYGSEDPEYPPIEGGENSFFVADLQDKGRLKKDLLALGEEFEQDTVIFGKAASVASLHGSNKCPGNTFSGKTVKQGGALFGHKAGTFGAFLSRVRGRPFVFAKLSDRKDLEKTEEYGVCKFPTELRGPVTIANMDWKDIII